MSKPFVVITGISGGIGSATATLFTSEGWAVAGLDNKKPDPKIPMEYFLEVDLSSTEETVQAFRELNERGPLDALVNNAAIQTTDSIGETDPDVWDLVMAVNVRAAYLGIKHCMDQLKSRSGSIVNVASVHSFATSPNVAAYAASKGALLSLTRAAAVELAPFGIRVNALAPGAVDTPMLRSRLGRHSADSESMTLDRLSARTPLRAIARPSEIAEAVLFLADRSRSSFMTGQCLVLDGGALAQLSTE